MNSARSLYETGRPKEALDLLTQLGRPHGKAGDGLLFLLGCCHARLRQKEPAVRAFTELLQSEPDHYDAITWMAVLKKNRRDMSESLGYAHRAIELRADDAIGYSALGACYLSMQQAAEAIAAFQRATELAPDVAEHHHNLSLALLLEHRHGEAIPHLRRAIELAPTQPQSYLSLSSTYTLFGMAGESLDCLSQGLSQIPNSAALHSAAAAAFASIRNDEAAERHHLRAIALSDEFKAAYATWLLNQGRFSDADAIYEPMLRDPASRPAAYYGILQHRKLSDSDLPMVVDMERLASDRSIGAGGEMRVRYALGKAHEQLKNYERAMGNFDSANRIAYTIHRSAHPFDIEKCRSDHESVKRYFGGLQEFGLAAESPIFIVGMIRSGTTLLDQIVSSHSAVSAAGELRFWIEESLRLASQDSHGGLSDVATRYVTFARLLAGNGERFTDKMPLNFAYLGILHRALPNAKFLHIRRHPVDTCLSIYTTYFGQGSLFAYDRATIRDYYREYLRMMNFWRAEIPSDRLMELDYEDLVRKPHDVVPQIIDFCGLPWDEKCLRHHENAVAINTPSRWQARQPIYGSSADRWRKYEPWLGEFADLMPESSRIA